MGQDGIAVKLCYYRGKTSHILLLNRAMTRLSEELYFNADQRPWQPFHCVLWLARKIRERYGLLVLTPKIPPNHGQLRTHVVCRSH